MKISRPLFITALSILVVIYAINTMPGSIVYASLALFALFTIIHHFTRRKYTCHLLLFLVSAVIGLSYFSIYNIKLTEKLSDLEKQEMVTVIGEVTEVSVSSAPHYTIRLDSVNGEKISGFKVIVYSGDVFETGDCFEMVGKFKSFTRRSNYLYNYAKGVWGYFYPTEIIITPENTTISAFFSKIRVALVDKARRIFASDTVPMAVAMGIGDKSLLDSSTVNAFNFTGTTHALVVSGLHVGFIFAVISGLLYFVPVKKKLKNIVSLVFVFMFMGIASFSPSIVRAGVLVIALTLGRNYLLEVDNYTTLAIIILITLFINPYSANNASLLLSYTSYFGVIYALEISKEKEYGNILSSLLMTVFAVLYTSPVMAMIGMEQTWLSPVFNLFLSIPIMVVCVLSFFLPVISFVPVIGELFVLALSPVNEFFIRFLLWFTAFAEKHFAFAMVNLGTDLIKVFIFASVIAVACGFIQFNSNRLKRIFIITVPILAVLCYNYLNKDTVTLQVFDGSSNPSYLISYNDENYMVVSENINSTRFANIMDNFGLEYCDEIIFCGKKQPDTELYSEYTDNLKIRSDDTPYRNDIYSIDKYTSSKAYSYVISIGDTKIGFSQNKADLTGLDLDFYFFGSDTPGDVSADNYFYFYPNIKKNLDITREKQAVELYGNLTIKIDLSTGQYHIVEDVKNFGSGL